MTPFYTRKGDDGLTGLLGDGSLPKFDLRMDAIGALDEATAFLGLARTLCTSEGTPELILELQRSLYQLMAEAASTSETANQFLFATPEQIQILEGHIERLTIQVKMPREFIVSGDSQAQAALDIARTVVRRAERKMAAMLDRGDVQNYYLLAYLNRLSSLLFVMSLFELQFPPTTAKQP